VPSEAGKYINYARECVRLAGHAETPEARDKLIELARVWMDAAMTEQDMPGRRNDPRSTLRLSVRTSGSGRIDRERGSAPER
jgi:hypothetical protein